MARNVMMEMTYCVIFTQNIFTSLVNQAVCPVDNIYREYKVVRLGDVFCDRRETGVESAYCTSTINEPTHSNAGTEG